MTTYDDYQREVNEFHADGRAEAKWQDAADRLRDAEIDDDDDDLCPACERVNCSGWCV